MARSPIDVSAFDATETDIRRAVTLPPECYSSERFFEFEKEAIFFRDWLCVGRADQIPEPGDYFTITLLDEPLVILRDEQGDVAAFSAVCRHRSALVIEGEGNCGRNLRCPYHWWTYGLDGRLLGAPEMHETEGFHKDEVRLPRMPVELWNGFVFVSFEQEAEPLAPRLSKIEEVMANYHADELVTAGSFTYDAPWNWKVMVENGTEHYHAVFLHSRFVPKANAESHVPPWEGDDDGSIVSILPARQMDTGISPHGGMFLPPIPTLSDEDRSRIVFAAVPPNLHIGLEADLILWFILLPKGHDRTEIRWSYAVPPEVRAAPSFDAVLELIHRGVEAFNDEDWPINSGMQRGLSSRFAERGRYSVEEQTAGQVARWVIKRYRDEDRRSTRIGSAAASI